jgi:2-deoxy-D-gluconate 3-dehydrogenase
MSVFLQQKFGLAGKVALVTGSSQGLGKAMAIALARAGADVIINGRDAGKLAPVVAEITALELGVKVHAIAADLGDRAGVHGLIDQAIGWQSQLDILVNNAGIIKRTPAADHTDADWDAVIDVNLNGVFTACRAAGCGAAADAEAVHCVLRLEQVQHHG